MKVCIDGTIVEITDDDAARMGVIRRDNWETFDYRRTMRTHAELQSEMLIDARSVRRDFYEE